jgi:NADPH:quinone reductase-like Zn-dependent oxidoreductase
MQAIVYDRYGPPDVLQLREVEDPVIGETEVLVRVRAASANPLDWFAFNGTPYVARPGFGLKKPDSARLGADLAGVVEAVGRQVTGFQPGDEVFGAGTGSFAELATVGKTGALSAKPASLTFEQAAAVPVAGLTALQGLRDKGGIQPGKQVLISGASGGVGTFAVQIAKTFDTQVTAVCSTGTSKRFAPSVPTESSTTSERISRVIADVTTSCSMWQGAGPGPRRNAPSDPTPPL